MGICSRSLAGSEFVGQAGDVHLSKPNLLTGFAVGQIKSEGGKAGYQGFCLRWIHL